MDLRFHPADSISPSAGGYQHRLTPLASDSQPRSRPHSQSLPPLHSHPVNTPQSHGLFDSPGGSHYPAHILHPPNSLLQDGIFSQPTHYSSMGDHTAVPAYMSPGTTIHNPSFYGATASNVQGYPSVLAPSPLQIRLPDVRPTPTGELTQSIHPPLNGLAQLTSQQPSEEDEPQPVHVVGAQGRRGILPSAPGKETPLAGSSIGGSKTTTVPAKDADGKFPCPYCSKTYLHAKHLKRHLLRRESRRNPSLFRSADIQ